MQGECVNCGSEMGDPGIEYTNSDGICNVCLNGGFSGFDDGGGYYEGDDCSEMLD